MRGGVSFHKPDRDGLVRQEGRESLTVSRIECMVRLQRAIFIRLSHLCDKFEVGSQCHRINGGGGAI